MTELWKGLAVTGAQAGSGAFEVGVSEVECPAEWHLHDMKLIEIVSSVIGAAAAQEQAPQ